MKSSKFISLICLVCFISCIIGISVSADDGSINGVPTENGVYTWIFGTPDISGNQTNNYSDEYADIRIGTGSGDTLTSTGISFSAPGCKETNTSGFKNASETNRYLLIKPVYTGKIKITIRFPSGPSGSNYGRIYYKDEGVTEFDNIALTSLYKGYSGNMQTNSTASTTWIFEVTAGHTYSFVTYNYASIISALSYEANEITLPPSSHNTTITTVPYAKIDIIGRAADDTEINETIYSNGKGIAEAVLSATKVDSTYTATVSKNGYLPNTADFSISNEVPNSVSVNLQPNSGILYYENFDYVTDNTFEMAASRGTIFNNQTTKNGIYVKFDTPQTGGQRELEKSIDVLQYTESGYEIDFDFTSDYSFGNREQAVIFTDNTTSKNNVFSVFVGGSSNNTIVNGAGKVKAFVGGNVSNIGTGIVEISNGAYADFLGSISSGAKMHINAKINYDNKKAIITVQFGNNDPVIQVIDLSLVNPSDSIGGLYLVNNRSNDTSSYPTLLFDDLIIKDYDAATDVLSLINSAVISGRNINVNINCPPLVNPVLMVAVYSGATLVNCELYDVTKNGNITFENIIPDNEKQYTVTAIMVENLINIKPLCTSKAAVIE